MAAAAALFLIGLFPSYVSILIVEKYYTAYWTGFWNLYCLFATSVGLALDNYNSLDIWVPMFFIFAIIFVIFVYHVMFPGRETESQKIQSHWVRRFGASWIATSLNRGLLFAEELLSWIGLSPCW